LLGALVVPLNFIDWLVDCEVPVELTI